MYYVGADATTVNNVQELADNGFRASLEICGTVKFSAQVIFFTNTSEADGPKELSSIFSMDEEGVI